MIVRLYECEGSHTAPVALHPGFAVTAVSSDGIIEAIERDNIIGVQWHPEAAMDMDFFRAFVDRFIVKK